MAAVQTRNIIVTATNDLYMPLALGLLHSLRAQAYSVPFDLGVLDVGLSLESRAQLAAFGARVITAAVDIDYPSRAEWESKLLACRAQTVRPYLPRYFPGYDVVLWADADLWMQTPDAVTTALTEAVTGELCIVSEIDRDYSPYFLGSQPWEHHLNWYREGFTQDIIGAVFPRPMLNSGFFALRSDSPVWGEWASVYAACLARQPHVAKNQFMFEQMSLNIAVYTKGFRLKVLPAEYNWLTLYSLPLFDEASGLFVRPTAPRTPISALHLTHKSKPRSFEIATVQGNVITRTLLNEKAYGL